VVLAGPRDPEELKYWYSAADVFCLASSREGCPNVVLESLACGTPVVATAVGAVPDILYSQNWEFWWIAMWRAFSRVLSKA
jgi:glycosyltransferase involved in cell wall biosynthesis